MKTYKNICLLSSLLFVLLTISSCNKNIDLDPQGIVTADGYFKSEDDFEKALNALYARFNYDNYTFWMDAVSDDAIVTHSWNWGYNLGRGIGNTASSLADARWNSNYISIQRANNVVNNIDSYEWPEGENDENRNQILGEARTIRSFFYLDQLCLFGRIMFYEKNPSTVEESLDVPQIEDPKVVFDFILDDLNKAILGLKEKAPTKSRIGTAAARLLRARAAAYAAGYLNDKSYFQITLDETAQLLATAPALGEYEDLFRTGNETIEEVILVKTYSEDIKNDWGNWYNNSIAGYCVTTPVKALVDSYEYISSRNEEKPYLGKDPRFYTSIYAPGMEIRGKYYNTVPGNTVELNGKTFFDPNKAYGLLQDKEVLVGDVLGEAGGGEWNKTLSGFTWKKYFTLEDTWNTWNSYVIFRYAEAYLLRAEALVESGGSETEVKSLLKVIRDRAGNTNNIDDALSTLYKGSLLDMVRNERRVEMANEGLRLFDIRRWKILTDVMNKPVEGIEYFDYSPATPIRKTYIVAEKDIFTEKDYWWPIPQAEIDLNKGRITQNKDW